MADDEQNMSMSEIKIGNNDSEQCLIPGYSSLEEFTKNGFKTLIEATKNSNSLPQDRDWDFYNTHQSFRNLMSTEGDSILRVINDVLKQQSVSGNIKNRDFDEKIELIIEANDVILERVANNLDELAGIRKNPELPVEIQTVSAEIPVSGSWNKLNNAKITVSASSSTTTQNLPKSANSVRLLTAKNIQRPQKFFKDKIDNSKSPWEPKIKDKPNNMRPLAIFLEETADGLGEIFCHPYELELFNFTPCHWQLTPVKPLPSLKPLSVTPLHMVDTPEALNRLLETLREQQQFAVDLEHHSYRSYQGFTCLVQISTAEEDFLVDTLVLRDKLWVLNEVFTKPTILKVFHGADNDIHWLQRDLALYVVNMFDTHQAAKLLGYPQLSLAYLLRKHCRVDTDKRFQLADWRIRPLPEELQTYAREDTHYLLRIASILRNELLQKGENILRAVYTASTDVCKRRYEKPQIHENIHLDLYRRCKKLFDNRQMYALKHLYHWRDTIAREEDESTGYVLPNHMLLQISELLPREMQGILACCNPIPPIVRSSLLELHRIVLRAREQPLVRPILAEQSHTQSHRHAAKSNPDTQLNCPHEIHREDFRDDLPTLLNNPEAFFTTRLQQSKSENKLETCTAKLSVFDSPENSDDEKEKKTKLNSKMKRLKFLGPYERYKLVKKYVQAEEKQKEDDEQTQANRTDTERIEALHDHFKSLASTTVQISALPTALRVPSVEEQTPVTLGQPIGVKRKREDSPDNSTTMPQPKIPRTPVQNNQQPNQKPSSKKKKKRKNKNMQMVNEQLHGKNNQQPNQQNQQQNQQNQQNKQQNQNNNSNKRGGKRKWQNQRNEGPKPKFNKNNENGGGDLKPFNTYTDVDFQRFQGGAGSAQQTKKINANFKGKGPKNKKFDNIGRTNIRSGNFRGRGRGGKGGW